MTDATEPRPPEQPPVAFVYDRHATTTKVVLAARLDRDRDYAVTRGWQIGGWFLDEGDNALSDDTRPAFEALCNTMAATAQAGRTVVCLVDSWDRLTRDAAAQARLLHQVEIAGGWTETTAGETCRGGRSAALPAGS